MRARTLHDPDPTWLKPYVYLDKGCRRWTVLCPCGYYRIIGGFAGAQAKARSHTSGMPGDPRRTMRTCRVGQRQGGLPIRRALGATWGEAV